MPRGKKKETPFSKTLTELMEGRNLTIKDTARIAKVPISTLGDWKSGCHPDNFDAVQRLANHFGVSLSYLLTGREDNISKKNVPTIQQVFSNGGALFDGYAHITIQRLIPRSEVKDED